MAIQRQMMLKEPIKRFLIQCVAKSGPEPELLMNELELCRKFNVSRITVHRAVEDLLRIGYIIHLPKRRGVFSNPKYAKFVPYSIGILSVSGNCSYVDSYNMVTLGSFLSELKKIKCMCSFITLNEPPEHVFDEIRNIGLDGIFWLTPEDCYIPAVNQLIESGFPIVTVTPNWADFKRAQSNYVGIDYEYNCRGRAEYFIHQGCRNIVFCGQSTVMFNGFSRILKSKKIFHEELRFFNSEDVKKGLPALLDTGTFDGLFCEWENSLHYTVLDILNKHPYGPNIKVLLSNGLPEQELRDKYPMLQLHSLHSGVDQQVFMNIGRRSAQKMIEMLRDGKTRFEPELFRWNLQF